MKALGTSPALAASATPSATPGPRCVFDGCPWTYGYPMDEQRTRHICFMHLINSGIDMAKERTITARGAVALIPTGSHADPGPGLIYGDRGRR